MNVRAAAPGQAAPGEAPAAAAARPPPARAAAAAARRAQPGTCVTPGTGPGPREEEIPYKIAMVPRKGSQQNIE